MVLNVRGGLHANAISQADALNLASRWNTEALQAPKVVLQTVAIILDIERGAKNMRTAIPVPKVPRSPGIASVDLLPRFLHQVSPVSLLAGVMFFGH